MTIIEFKEAFKRGLGSAILELISTDKIEQYRDIVLFCYLHNTCYDMQSEGQRSDYLYVAIKEFPDAEFFEQKIIKEYTKKSICNDMFDQLSSLLFKFANDGSNTSKTVLN